MGLNVIHELHETVCRAELHILDTDGAGVVGQKPTVRIQRISDSLWSDFADNTFKAVPGTPIVVMSPVNAVKSPGLYRYEFVRATWTETGEESYEFVYNNTGVYDGDDSDLHRWVDLTSSDLNVGANQVSLYVKERTSLEAIVGCDVDVWVGLIDAVGAVRYTRKTTNGAGLVTLFLDDGTYKVYLSDPTHTIFTYPETLIVITNMTYTMYGDAFDPGSKPANTTRIYSWEHDADGATPLVSVRVSAWPTDEGQYQTWGGIGHRNQKKNATTTSAGYWSLDLSPGIEYTFDMESSRGKMFERLTIPTSGNSQFEDLI